MRKDQWPELPPTYTYACLNSRIYISYLHNERRNRLCIPYTRKEQYWNDPKNAALAAWKHYASALKEELDHATRQS